VQGHSKRTKIYSKCPENSHNFTASLALQPALGFLQYLMLLLL